MPPGFDDAAFASKFLDDLTARVQDVPQMRARLDALTKDAEQWRKDHDSIMHAQFLSKLLKFVTPVLQLLVVAVLVPMFYFLMDLRDGKIEAARDIRDLRASMQDQTFAPPDWQDMQATVQALVKANEIIGTNMATLTTQVNNLTQAVAKSKPTRVDVHPTSTIIMQKPDQSRAIVPFRSTPVTPGGRP